MTQSSPDFIARHGPSPALLLTLWLLAGVVMLSVIDVAPVARTQEARVLVTAREMVGRPLHDWLVPRTNGEVRLRKPPLAYWLTAGVFTITGRANEALGRLPAAAAGWMTIALTFLIARRLFNARAGLFAAGTMLGSRLFFKFTLLAETDALVMAEIATGVWLIFSLPDAVQAGRGVAWRQHALAACMAAAVMTKGPPAAYLVVLLALTAWVAQRRHVLTTFFTSGAVVTCAVLALPWFVYAVRDPQFSQLTDDLRNSAEGGKGHSGHFWSYGPLLAESALPWTGVWLIALLGAAGPLLSHLRPEGASLARGSRVRKKRDDRGKRSRAVVAARWRGRFEKDQTALVLLSCWGLSILAPLCGWGNKQEHYLMPLMPAVFCLVGWWLDQWLSRASAGLKDPTMWVLGVFATVCAACAAAVLPVAVHVTGGARPIDFLTVSALASGTGVCVWAWRAFGRIGMTYSALLLGILTCGLVAGVWVPALDPTNTRATTGELRRTFPTARFVFLGAPSLPLVFEMGQQLPGVTPDQLPAGPDVVLLERLSDPQTPPPAGFVERLRIEDGDSILRASTR